ncbi:peptidase C14, caspase catalytic subunit p20, partial [Candidatus Thiomargarita nelsonii]
ENYLFPIGAMQSVTVAEHLPYETLRVGYLLATMEGARNNLNVVILDACRNNPFARSLFIERGVDNPDGLALMEVPSGTLIAYATRPNKRALDGTGRNSPYVKHLKRELPKQGLSIVEVLTNVRVAVKKETKNRQAPGYYSELDRKFCFVGPCGQNTPSQSVTVPVSDPTPVLKSDRDRDGVADSLDNCPYNTSAEISAGVDSRGCPLDRDQDGVADYRDSCLGTSAGVSVKQNGCPVPKTTVSKPSSSRYRDNGDGTVTDNLTGLIWMKNANCSGRRMTWKKAMQWAAKLAHGQCGLRDGSRAGMWRLPTIDEWKAMVDKRYTYPALSNAAGT